MNTTIFLAECMDKKFHSEDCKTVSRLRKIIGIDDAFETHVRVVGKEYCIAAISHSEKKDQKKLSQIIKKDVNIKSVQIFTEKQVPF